MIPTGARLRRLTRAALAVHGGGRAGDLFNDVYTAAIGLAVSGALVIGIANEFALGLRAAPTARVDVGWLGWAGAVLTVGAGLALAGRIGPIFLNAGYSAWWLPTPVDRRGLLRPRLTGTILIGAGIGAAAGIPVAILLGGPAAAIILALAAGSALATAGASTHQVRARPRRNQVPPAVRLGELLIAASLVPVGLGAVLPGAAPDLGWWWWAGALGCVIAAGAVWIGVARRLENVWGPHLRERGMLAAGLHGAAQSFDTRELGFFLNASADGTQRLRRSRRFRPVRSAPAALIAAEALQLLRTPRHLAQVAIGAAIPLLSALAGWSVWVTGIGMLAGGLLSASALAGPARHAYRSPAVDGLWPMSASAVRWCRLALPSAVMVLWGAGIAAIIGGFGLAWIALGIASGPVFAAGAIRSAYRKPVDWSAPLVTTPDGQAIPPGAFSAISVGPDLPVLAGLPLWLAIGAVGPTPTLIGLQTLASALALLAAANTHRSKKQQ